MLIEPRSLADNLDIIEDIEKASMRLVVQGLLDFRDAAQEIFADESDLAADIGEDITREALDSMGMSRVGQRLYGKMDYKRARYVFHPEYAIKQALFIDSKAEKNATIARLQLSQCSMVIHQILQGEEVHEQGELPCILTAKGQDFLTTTIFVKYHYREDEERSSLLKIIVAALPNGLLQDRYNPDCTDCIWGAGPHSPARGEAFRVRLRFALLKGKMPWRVQTIPMPPTPFAWQE